MKVWTIAWKDALIRLRDRNALILTLLAPLLITGIMGAALGGSINDERAKRRDVPLVVVVNQDEGDFGKALSASLSADGGQGLLKTVVMSDLGSARASVNDGQAQAVIQIPRNFSRRLQASGLNPGESFEDSAVQVSYGASATTTTAQIISEVIKQATLPLSTDSLGQRLAAEKLPATKPDAARAQQTASQQVKESKIEVKFNNVATGEAKLNLNPFAFFAPSLAIFFLMISMFEAPRSILVEQEEGTLGRLLRTPTSPAKILLGKLGGSYLTGILQFVVLVLATRLIFNLSWGHSWFGLILMVTALVVASASMGALIAAFSKDVVQAGALGGGIALLSAGLGGNFFAVDNLPRWLQILSRLTINRWALEGFSNLTVKGLGLNDILLNAGVLFAIAAGLFVLAFWKFQRRLAG